MYVFFSLLLIIVKDCDNLVLNILIMQSKKILVVDDIVDNIQLIVNVFSIHEPDYILYQANSAEIALMIAEKTLPDIIITDWDMPEMTGIDLINNLKENPKTSSIPVIMATGVMTTVEHLKIALEAGATDYLEKPINEVELVARTRSALNLAQYHKNLLEQKDRELVESTLFLMKNNEFNIKITQKLENLLNKENEKKRTDAILEIIDDIEQKVKTDSWQRFETSFNSVHDQFYKNFLKDFPDLTANELKLAAFLKLGLTSKEIASVLFINPDSVKVARSRLRKKLNLKSDKNLQVFLSKY